MNPKPKTVAHTPTPWIYGDADQNDHVVIMTEGGNVIALCPKHGAGFVGSDEVAPWHHAKANAQLIVRAVNSYAALVDALSHLLKEMEFAFDDVPPGVDAWMAIARTALKAAVNPESTKEQTL